MVDGMMVMVTLFSFHFLIYPWPATMYLNNPNSAKISS